MGLLDLLAALAWVGGLHVVVTRKAVGLEPEPEIRLLLRVIASITALMVSASIATAQQPGTANPDRRGDMSSQNPMSMATMESLNQRLDSLVGRMNRVSGNQKVQAMAAVINETVAQRKAMQERMHQMMRGREGMMKMMVDSAASDTARHEGHHPPK